MASRRNTKRTRPSPTPVQPPSPTNSSPTGSSESEDEIPLIETYGLNNIVPPFSARWNRLAQPNRTILPTRFLCLPTLDTLGLREPVSCLLRRGGLHGLLDLSAHTYERYTLEFLATIDAHVGPDRERFITFHLNDAEYRMSYDQIRQAFGLDTVLTGYRDLRECVPFNYDPAIFFGQLTGSPRLDGNTKASAIIHPAFRIVHRLLSYTLFAKADPAKINWLEVKFLHSISPDNRDAHPDWVQFFVSKCVAISKQIGGRIYMGGLVTIIARFLGIPVPLDIQPVASDDDSIPLFDMAALSSMHMLQVTIERPPRYIWRHGPAPGAFMYLPNDKTALTAQTTNADLCLSMDEELVGGHNLPVASVASLRRPTPAQQDSETAATSPPPGSYDRLHSDIVTLGQQFATFGQRFDSFEQRYIEDQRRREDDTEVLFQMMASMYPSGSQSFDYQAARAERTRRRHDGAGPSH